MSSTGSGGVRVTRRVVPFEVKAVGDGASLGFTGYAAVTKNLDHHGDIIAPGAFSADLAWFLANGFVGGLNHDWAQPVGVPLSAVEDAKGLLVSADVRPTAAGKDLMLLMRPGADGARPVVKRLSIGYEILGREYLETSDEVKAYWASVGYEPTPLDLAGVEHGARLLTRVRLLEFSPVTLAANELCEIETVKGAAKSGRRGRLPFGAELSAARAAVGEVCERAEALHSLRAKSGRSLSVERRRELTQMLDRIAAAIQATAAAPTPDAEPSDGDAGGKALSEDARRRRLNLNMDSLLELGLL